MKNPTEKFEEYWDESNQAIGSDIYDLENFAGRDVVVQSDFYKALSKAYNLALQDAAEAVRLKVHDGTIKQDFPSKWHQEGANNVTVDKQSILDLMIE